MAAPCPAETHPSPKPEGFRWVWERDRPGSPGWRFAGQSYAGSAGTGQCGPKGEESFRRDAENGGRDDRAPQSNCIVPAKSVSEMAPFILHEPGRRRKFIHQPYKPLQGYTRL